MRTMVFGIHNLLSIYDRNLDLFIIIFIEFLLLLSFSITGNFEGLYFCYYSHLTFIEKHGFCNQISYSYMGELKIEK